jgi:uncharacterized membrane protein YeaQ/YmgE (transglycosylase-associated protein family)
MIGTIVGAIFVGLIVGALAPGLIHRDMGHLQIGIHQRKGGFEIIPFLVGIIVAVILIAIYMGITGGYYRPGGASRYTAPA